MTAGGMCVCAMGCARNPLADPGVFGHDCSCWCHDRRDSDPLLEAISNARQRKEQADRGIRLLLAYAREHVTPRPYRLADLAQAAGMSLSGVRTAYTRADITHAARLTGGARARHLEAVTACLLADSSERYPAA